MLHAPSTSFFLILSPEQNWVRSTDHLVPHYVLFSTLLLPRPSYAQTSSSEPFFKTPLAYIPPYVSEQVPHSYKTGKIIVLYMLIFKLLDNKPEDKRFCTE